MDNQEVRYKSPFHVYREQYQPRQPKVLQADELSVKTQPVSVVDGIKPLFAALTENPLACTFEAAEADLNKINTPLRIGCVLSGGQAAGGHNVIVGLYEYIKKRNPNSQLFGFLEGPIGVMTGNYTELRDDTISFYKNRGGFDMIRSGRDKIETPEQFERALKYCKGLKLDGLVVIGGDDSNTNACLLANYFKAQNCETKVVGCPKTIDGDLKNEYVEVSFGFDTACKTYAELIGNIMQDTISSKKYYHFIRLMGRSASHIALECAVLTRPNYCFIGEEVKEKGVTLQKLVSKLVDIIIERQKAGKDYGVVLVPEGIVEFIDEMSVLISEINNILAKQLHGFSGDIDALFIEVAKYLTEASAALLKYLPKNISEQLLLDRDPHGNVQVAKIESEQLLIYLCQTELAKKKKEGLYDGKFATQSHYFGYEGRCSFPTNFDCDYCYNLGYNAAILIEKGFTGVMSVMRNLKEEPEKWIPGGFPLVTMMCVEQRHGKDKPVIRKALTELDGKLFKLFEEEREAWAMNDYYQQIGPVQFEFKCLTPYLVEAPTKEQIYKKEWSSGDYDKDNKPFFPVNPEFNQSELSHDRLKYEPELPNTLQVDDYQVIRQKNLEFEHSECQVLCQKHYQFAYRSCRQLVEVLKAKYVPKDKRPLTRRKGLKIGIVFNGRQSPGGENIVEGLHKFCSKNDSKLFGFINGTKGLLNNQAIEVMDSNLKFFRNQGGFAFLGRSADKVRSQVDLESTKTTCEALQLDGLVMVGASHTATDALLLSNYFLEKQVETKVIVVPATIDNNVGHHMMEAVVGFDTASKVYSQLIGNNMIDAASAVKYWYFMRVMGRDPSHLVLECALQTHPNITLISEEIVSKGYNLKDVVNYISDIVEMRAQQKKNFGTLLIPEGLLAQLPEFKQLIAELDHFFKEQSVEDQMKSAQRLITDKDYINQVLSPWSAARFTTLPDFTQKELVMERETSGSIQLSQVQTEKLLAHLTAEELKNRKKNGTYNGKFAPVCHFLGYQGRSSLPSNFDCDLGNAYGFLSGQLIEAGVTGYCCTARGVNGEVVEWKMGGIPLIHMTQVKAKSTYGEKLPIVPSHEVNLTKGAFKKFKREKHHWKVSDYYSNPGPIQFYGKRANVRTETLQTEHENYINHIKKIEALTQKINSECRFGTHEDLLQITITHLQTLEDTLQTIKDKYN